ncbi:MAG: flagellar basal body rod protein FlgB [Chloroflexi bacterium]|jgi:flagellar basal-body rod protein FlgB|nr:flagellar basal body rod protein FlgB [Anaerolineaceae bacterium]NMB87369.1 flagellar basal body rod protein FlgB [Chloroflexota bacterium]
MINSITNDEALQTAKLALDGLSLRQQAISNNLSNVDTPGYQAQTVDFESALQRSLKRLDRVELSATNSAHIGLRSSGTKFDITQRSGGTERADQNNVDIDTELIDMSETGIQYQAVSQQVTKKLSLLKAIATSR